MSKYNWDGLNWAMTNKQLVEITGASMASVSYQRRKRDGAQFRQYKHWGLIDWSKPTNAIAAQTGRCRGVVLHARKKYAPETLEKRKRAIKSDVWREVDWGLQSSVIASRLECSVQSVSMARARYS